jgi:hypothetical protein
MMDHRLAAAVRENAEWVDLVCRAHGLPTTFTPDCWHTARRSPPFCPDAETLRPGVAPSAVLEDIETGPGGSVVAHLSGDVVGLSNLRGPWVPALASIAAAFPDRAIVGYEQHLADPLRLGFEPLGPLRVWHWSAP